MASRYIYKITNSINGKLYVGQTYSIVQRKAGHLYAAKKNTEYPLYRAMNKYGVDAFIFEVIEECDEHNVDEREKFWIKELNTRDNKHGYNLTEGGSGNSEQTRRKLSEALKGNKHCVGRIASPETRAKLSAHCGHPLSEEHKQKLRKTVRVPNDGFTGHTHTEEARNKIRKARRGSVRSQETKDKISATMKARKKHLDNSTSV